MGTKMKGFYKGMKYLSQIFVVKEHEFEIGYPTDVKHVAHIGADGLGGAPPSWMNEFKADPDYSALSFKEKKSISSKGLNQSTRKVGSPTAQKKHRRRKPKSTTSSPKATSGHSRTSRSKGIQQTIEV
ncbi:hypothetical protein QQ045_021629 [Rhodiola kirilowii]